MQQKNIMVCVTQQKNCEKLIRVGYNIYNNKDKNKDNNDNQLYVIHVANEKDKLLYNLSDGDALEYLFERTKELGADLVVKRSKDVIKTLVDFAKEKDITHIVLGYNKNSSEERTFEKKLHKLLHNIEFIS